MLDNSLPISLQYQLYKLLYKKISDGKWPEGFQIPSERELCEEYSVSRITVREAIKTLVQEGYLVRKQGKGTYVSAPKFEQQLTSYFSLSQEIEKRGLQSEFKVFDFRKEEPSISLREIFKLSDGEKVFVIERLRFIGNKAFAWEKSIVPETMMANGTKEEIMVNGLYPTINKYSGVSPHEAEEEVQAANCPEDIATLMNIEKHAAVLHITRLTKTKDDYIELCESYIHGEMYKYKHMIKKR
ncbi:MAG TPA: GntR family transcriptional regulator [Clostridiales bacterium]|nr:GntR family transcriptional regulator [Clostridiales bacterium]